MLLAAVCLLLSSCSGRTPLASGCLLLDTGSYKEAIKEFDLAIADDPKLEAAWAKRADAYDELGNFTKAAEDYAQAVALGRRDAETYNMLAWENDHLGKYQQALSDCTMAIKSNAKYPNAFCSRADVNMRQGNYQAAIDDCNAAIQLGHDCVECYLVLAISEGKLGGRDKERVDCDKAISAAGKSWSRCKVIDSEEHAAYAAAYHYRSEADKALGNDKLAEQDAAEASSLGYRAPTEPKPGENCPLRW
jgi:tetratricopeptide (TPR) repeat protein